MNPLRAIARRWSARHSTERYALVACVAIAASVNSMALAGSSDSGCRGKLEDFEREATRLELKHQTWKPATGKYILEAYEGAGLDGSMDDCAESAEELGGVFSATRTVAFYNPDHEGMTDRLYDIFGRLRDAEQATTRHQFHAYQALVANRQFERANLVAARSERLRAYDVRDEGGSGDGQGATPRTVLTPTSESGVVERREVELPEGRGLVVIFDTSCGVSISLLSRIYQDEDLLDSMMGRTILLIPQSSPLDPRAVRTWQENQPFDIYWMYREREWPEIDSRLTPTIYFFEDGERVASIEGAQEGVVDRLTEFLD